MKIAGIEKCSLVDWPGKISVALFTPGCNLNCFFCHNRALLTSDADRDSHQPGAVLQWICDRRDFVDGIVITGGEPTIQPGLPDFIADIRLLGFGVKLDTNGTRPEVLSELLRAGLVDYVAMDVKAPRDKYNDVCDAEVDQAALDASIRLLTTSPVEHEFRTTVLPQFTEDDIVAIARRITGARNYVLQRLRPPIFADGHRDVRLEAKYQAPQWFERAMDRAVGFVRSCETRGIDELAFVTRRCA
jgi:pyruvate formate lyase activating enzyme